MDPLCFEKAPLSRGGGRGNDAMWKRSRMLIWTRCFPGSWMTIKLSVPACNHRAESGDMRGLDAWSAPMKDGPSVARGPREAVWGVAGNSRPTRPNDRLVMITVLCHNWKKIRWFYCFLVDWLFVPVSCCNWVKMTDIENFGILSLFLLLLFLSFLDSENFKVGWSCSL